MFLAYSSFSLFDSQSPLPEILWNFVCFKTKIRTSVEKSSMKVMKHLLIPWVVTLVDPKRFPFGNVHRIGKFFFLLSKHLEDPYCTSEALIHTLHNPISFFLENFSLLHFTNPILALTPFVIRKRNRNHITMEAVDQEDDQVAAWKLSLEIKIHVVRFHKQLHPQTIKQLIFHCCSKQF